MGVPLQPTQPGSGVQRSQPLPWGVQRARARRRRRTFALTAAAIAVASVGAYLADCIPGVPFGGAPTAPSQPEVSARSNTGVKTTIVVSGDRCRRDGAPAVSCVDSCQSVVADEAVNLVVLRSAEGSHGVVETLRICLERSDRLAVRIEGE